MLIGKSSGSKTEVSLVEKKYAEGEQEVMRRVRRLQYLTEGRKEGREMRNKGR